MKGKGITERGRLTAALAVTLIVAVVCFFSLNSFSFGATSEKSGKSSSNKVSTTDSSGGNDGKETVYIMQKANGNEYKRVVSDEGNLKYKGYDDAQLPVTMKVSYTLDGKAISPADLAGESGHVKIHITYTNNIKRNNVYVPFAVMTAFIFDNDDFSNVSVDNGKVIDDGTRNTVVGYALPGLSESLSLNLSELDSGAKDIDIPESVTIECDTTKYNVENAYSVVTDEMFQDIDMSDVNNASDLKDKMDEVKSAAKKLANGTSQLSNGADKVASGAGKLSAASKTIKNGAKDVASGTNLLKSKTPALAGGVSKLAAGSKQVSDGNAALLAGLKEMHGQVNVLASGASDVSKGANVVSKGIPQVISEITDKLEKITANNDSINKGTDEVVDTIITSVNQQMKAAGLNNISITEENYAAQIGSAISKADSGISQYDAAIKKLEADGQSDSDTYKEAVAAKAKLEVEKANLQETKKQLDALTNYHSGVKSYTQGVSDVLDGIEKSEDISELEAGAKSVASGADSVSGGVNKVKDALSDDGDLVKGAQSLSQGSKEVYDGVVALQGGSTELVSGVNKLASGSMQLYNGTVIFSSKEAELASGAAALAPCSCTMAL